MEPSCLFCLDPVNQNGVPNPIGCPCKIVAHKKCFELWFRQKNQMECPICHMISIPNRIMLDDIHIVYINMTETQAEEQRRRVWRGHEKAVGFCCCLFLGWAIGLSILEAITGTR